MKEFIDCFIRNRKRSSITSYKPLPRISITLTCTFNTKFCSNDFKEFFAQYVNNVCYSVCFYIGLTSKPNI
jgi:hypothetical protein